MTKRKFYRQLVMINILSEEPINFSCLREVEDAILTECSGEVRYSGWKEINGQECAKVLLEQDSDPGFFRLTEDGEDAE